MIVCSCNIITQAEIAEAVRRLRARDPYAVITPGLIFRTLGKRPNCGNCLPLVSRVMIEADGKRDETVDAAPRTCSAKLDHRNRKAARRKS